MATNAVPVAQATVVGLDEDTTLRGQLIATDGDGDALTYTIVSAPAHGGLVIGSLGGFSYTPAANYHGSDSFTFQVNDGTANSAVATVSLTIRPVNDPAIGGVRVIYTGGSSVYAQHDFVDADGLGTFDYMWQLDGVPVTRGPSNSVADNWSLLPADLGHRLSVVVSYTDRDGSVERAASSTLLVTEVSAPTGVRFQGLNALVGTAADDLLYAYLGNGLAASVAATTPTPFDVQRYDGGAGFDILIGRDGSFKALSINLATGLLIADGHYSQLQSIEGIYGGKGSDTLIGDDGPNLLAGDEQYDTLIGGGGNDTIVAGPEPYYSDDIDGGSGSDWFVFRSASIGQMIGGASGFRIDLVAGEAMKVGGSSFPLRSIENIVGSDAADTLLGSLAGGRLEGGAGNDWLVGNSGNDVLVGGLGIDTIDGGSGFDVVVFGGDTPVRADLATGTAFQDGNVDRLAGIDGLVGSSAADVLAGLDDAPAFRGQLFRGGSGNDSIDGGTGIDEAQFGGNRSDYRVTWNAGIGRLDVTDLRASTPIDPNDGNDVLTNIERLRFADGYLAFGTRAEEVARVAFVLWSPDIASHPSLFARGISFYDVGYEYRRLVDVALSFWPVSDNELAAQLVRNTPGTAHTTSELLQLMAAAGGGTEGRIAATLLMAEDVHTFQQVQLAGFNTNGIACDLNFGETVLFAPLPGA